MTDYDAVMDGFKYMKAIVNRYGVEDSADLMKLADRLVAQGEFKTRRAAIEEIERQNGRPVTRPIP